MNAQFIEEGCDFSHEGHTFTNGGAIVADGLLVGYCAEDMGSVKSWHGDLSLGKMRVVSSWPISSCLSNRMYAVRIVTPDGRRFHGKTLGSGMLIRARLMKGKGWY